MHLGLDHYLQTLRGDLPLLALIRHTRDHLMEVCPLCATEAARFGTIPYPLEPDDRPDAAPSPSDPRYLTRRKVADAKAHLSRLRTVATNAREDLRLLLALPPGRWADRVANTRTRMRSRTFVELLLAESRRRVRAAPRQAAALAALAPTALRWAEGRPDLPWLAPLLARAEAHRANALRVAGDLPAADRAFAHLRRRLAESPCDDPAASGEIASLEASLRIDQRCFDAARARLAEAAAAYRRAGQPVGVARVLVQTANLMGTMGEPEANLRLLEEATALTPADEPYLLATTVTARVNALCDLDRSAEAETLLAEHRDLYRGGDDDHLVANSLWLAGRVALGLGRLDDAEAHFAAARDRLLSLDRDYDAILAALHLADALLAAGKTAELKRLAADLVPLFRARGVARETLAALRLFAQAAKSERVTAAVLSEVRDKLEARARG